MWPPVYTEAAFHFTAAALLYICGHNSSQAVDAYRRPTRCTGGVMLTRSACLAFLDIETKRWLARQRAVFVQGRGPATLMPF